MHISITIITFLFYLVDYMIIIVPILRYYFEVPYGACLLRQQIRLIAECRVIDACVYIRIFKSTTAYLALEFAASGAYRNSFTPSILFYTSSASDFRRVTKPLPVCSPLPSAKTKAQGAAFLEKTRFTSIWRNHHIRAPPPGS